MQDKIIDHHSHIAGATIQRRCVPALHQTGGTDTGDQTLSGGFFIAGRSVDLSGTIKPVEITNFQRPVERARIDMIIFHRIAGHEDFDFFQPFHGADESELDIGRKRCADSVGIDKTAIETFRLEKDLMGITIGEPVNLVFDRRTIARSLRADCAAEQWRTMERLADDFMGRRSGPAYPAKCLRHRTP